MINAPSTRSCSYSLPPWPLVAASTRWYHELEVSTSVTEISGCGRSEAKDREFMR
jgi:hypothetical protein